jgi:amino acid transporter
MWLARLTAFGANANLFIAYLGYLSPGLRQPVPRAAILVAVSLLLVGANIRGIREGALVGDVLAAAKLVPMFLFVAIGLAAVDHDLLVPAEPPDYGRFLQAILLQVYAFTGFEFATIPAGEAVAPRRHLPGAMLGAVLLAAFLYTGIQVVCVGTLPDLARSQTAMADAAARFMGGAAGRFMAVAALTSIAGNLSGIYLVSPRLTYALAADGLLPAALAVTHPRYRTPWLSIVLFALLGLGLALGGTFVGLVRISVVARVGAYLLACLAVPVLRRKVPDEPYRFRIPGGAALPLAGALLCVGLLARSDGLDLVAGAAALAAGFLLSALGRRRTAGA